MPLSFSKAIMDSYSRILAILPWRCIFSILCAMQYISHCVLILIFPRKLNLLSRFFVLMLKKRVPLLPCVDPGRYQFWLSFYRYSPGLSFCLLLI